MPGALTSLAVLRVNWDSLGRDYVENFVPFVAECIRRSPDDVVSLPVLQECLTETFGLIIPQNSLRLILNRTAKRKFIIREHKAYFANREALQELTFEATYNEMMASQVEITTRLVRYAADTFGLEWNETDAENALLDFLETHDVKVLFALAEHTAIPVIGRSPQNSRFVVSSFISQLHQGDPEAFEHVESIVKGNLLANALFLPDPLSADRNFRKTQVFFDTGLLLAALGYDGKDRQTPMLELLDLLYGSGADLRVFEATLKEMQGILAACASRIRRHDFRDAHGPAIEYFLAEDYTSSDVDLLIARLPQNLRSLRIQVSETPDYEAQYLIDEQKLEHHLGSCVGYRYKQALLHDVDVISATVRLRKGRPAYRLEESRAVFVTGNTALARCTRDFLRDEVPGNSVAFCLSDMTLTNIQWLKNPTRAPSLPKDMVIAETYAALQPSADLWGKYLVEIARLEENGDITSNDYQLLRHSHASKSALVNATLGDEEAFTEGTVQQILETVHQSITARVRGELETERGRRRDAEKVAQEAQGSAQAMIRNQEQRAQGIASGVGRWTSRIALAIVTSLVLIGAIWVFPWGLPTFGNAGLRYLVGLSSLIVFALGIMGYFLGTLDPLSRKFEIWATEKARSWLENYLVPRQ